MTPEGTYVQLVNGVLTNVSVTPMMQVCTLSVQFTYSAQLSQIIVQIIDKQIKQIVGIIV